MPTPSSCSVASYVILLHLLQSVDQQDAVINQSPSLVPFSFTVPSVLLFQDLIPTPRSVSSIGSSGL